MRKMLNKDWRTVLGNKSTQEAMDLLDEAYQEAVEKWVPSRTIKPGERPKPPWMSQYVLKLAKKKNSAFIAYMYTKHPVARRKYYTCRNKSNHAVRNARRYFEKKLAEEVRNNAKGVWKYIKQQKASKSNIPDLKKPDGTLTSCDQEAADVLSNQYHHAG